MYELEIAVPSLHCLKMDCIFKWILDNLQYLMVDLYALNSLDIFVQDKVS